MSTPIGSGGQYFPGSPQDQATRAQAQQDSQNVLGSVGGAIGKATLGALGIKSGLIDQLLNTVFYSVCAIAGISAMIMGLNLIVKEIPGAAGVGTVLGSGGRGIGAAGSAVGGIGGKAVGFGKSIGGKIATVAAPEAAIPARAVAKVAAPAKKAVSSGPGEREKAARSAGMGAAQILRARREDAS